MCFKLQFLANFTSIYKKKSSLETKALNNLNLEVKEGEIFGLLGPNGAGKTTFLNILAGTVIKNYGNVNVWGYDLDKDGLLSKAEIEKEPVPDISGNREKQLLFEPLKKFDLNQDGKLALLEIPPYHSPFGSGMRMRTSARGSRRQGGGRPRPAGPSVLPGASVLNDELTRFNAETLQDLVDAGLYDSMEDLQATAPDGAVWGINPDTGLVVPIFP